MGMLDRKVPAGVKPTDTGQSAMASTNAGSGSRPTTSKYPIASSAPSEPHTLDRKPPGDWLK